MHVKAKVAVIYHGAADLSGCRLALAVAEGAWDAGAEVRVRRVQRLARPTGGRPDPEWAEVLREDEDVPGASPEDLDWADAVLFGTSIHDGAVRAQLGKLVRAVLPVLGGVFVPIGPTAPVEPCVEAPDRSPPMEMAIAPSATELAAARDRGVRLAETVLALKAGRSLLADVA